MVVEDAGDFELVAEGRMLKVAVADGSAVLEREATSDSAKGWVGGFFGFDLLGSDSRIGVRVALEGVCVSGLVLVEALLPLSLQFCEFDQRIATIVSSFVLVLEQELVRMAALEDECFGFCGIIS